MDHIAQIIGSRVLVLNQPGKPSEFDLSIGPIRKEIAKSSQMSYIGLSI